MLNILRSGYAGCSDLATEASWPQTHTGTLMLECGGNKAGSRQCWISLQVCVSRDTCLGEDDHRVHSLSPGVPDRVDQAMPPAQAVYPWHGVDGLVVLSVVHKHRQDQVGRGDVSL